MEDAHSFVADFAGVRGQGYFAVFDGHAGKHAAEWCGEHFHEELIEALHSFPTSAINNTSTASSSSSSPSASTPVDLDSAANLKGNGNGSNDTGAGERKKTSVPDVLNRTFHAVDANLSRMADEGQTHSGCTAVTAFLRLEDDDGNQPQSFVDAAREWQVKAPPNPLGASSSLSPEEEEEEDDDDRGPTGSAGLVGKDKTSSSGLHTKVKSAVRSITGRSPHSAEPEDIDSTANSTSTNSQQTPIAPVPVSTGSISKHATSSNPVSTFAQATRRVLYTANAGDARAVLSRGGRAVRLTYDHKGSDAQEAKRIKEAGGFVMNNRVNGTFHPLSLSFLSLPGLLCFCEEKGGM